MLYQLIRRDAAWKSALLLTVLTVVLIPATKLGNKYALVGMVAPLSFFLAQIAEPHRRLTMFEAGLPLSGRQIYLARLLALLSVVWLPVAAGIATAYAFGLPEWPRFLLISGVAFTPAVMLPLSLRLPLFTSPKWALGPVWILGMIAAAIGIPQREFIIFICLSLVVVGVIFAATWNTLPATFQAAPFEVADGPKRSTPHRAVASGWRLVIKLAFPWWCLLYIPIIIPESAGDSLLFGWCVMVTVYSQTRMRARWMDALPVSRRALLFTMVGAAVLPALIGAAISRQGASLVSQRAHEVRVPFELWQTAPHGKLPAVASPWGESYTPDVVTFSGHSMYNPYGADRSNGQRFVSWQANRARAAATLPAPDAIRFRILYAGAVATYALLIIALLELQMWRGLGTISSAARSALQIAVLTPFCFLPLLYDLVHMGDTSGSVTVGFLRLGIIHLERYLPHNVPTALVAAEVPVLLMLWLIEWQFRHSEQAHQCVMQRNLM